MCRSHSASDSPRHRCFGAVVFLICLAFGATTAQAELDIHVTSHQVWFIWHHSKIVVTYDQRNECTGCSADQITDISSDTEGCFTTARTSTGYCTTIGAGAVPAGSRARLFGETNRPSGLENELTSPPIAITPPENQTLQDVLQSLLNALKSHTDDWNCFEDKRMNYDLFPGKGDSYNSNSFISGITQFVGLIAPDLKPKPNVPGYKKLVPETRFEFAGCPNG